MTIRIAVVDDNAETQALLTDLFEGRGWEVLSCTEASGAFELIKEQRPDLVMLDLWLESPDSGWQVLEQMHGDPVTREIAVVISSGDAERLFYHQPYLDEHNIPVLVKPFVADDVYRSVDFALSSKSAGSPGNGG
jgi:CheY-like chemotaxis protein